MLTTEELAAASTNPYSSYYYTAFTPAGAKKLPLAQPVKGFQYYNDIYKHFLTDKSQFHNIYFYSTNDHPYDSLIAKGTNPNFSAAIDLNQAEIEQHIAAIIDNLFPTQQFNPAKPTILLSSYDITAIKSDLERLKTMTFHFAMMMKFYGFTLGLQDTQSHLTQHTVTVGFEQPRGQIPTWIKQGSPHYQYMTTMILSLRLLGLENYAQAFVVGLKKAADANPFGHVPTESWQDKLTAQLPAQQPVHTEEIPAANIKDTAAMMITSLKDYYLTQLMEDKGLNFFYKVERAAKRDAVLELLRVLTSNPSLPIAGINMISLDRLSIGLCEHKTNLLKAGAVARGYIVGVPDTTFKRFGQSQLHQYLEQLVTIQEQCVTGTLPAAPSPKGIV